MPKIDVLENHFFSLLGMGTGGSYGPWKTRDAFEEALSCAKAELDEDADRSLPPAERVLKIELNDTNRPDLWGTAGCARQLRAYYTDWKPHYDFFSRPGEVKKCARKVIVEGKVTIRPFLAGFIASGKAVTDASLRDMIQTQEKLAWNFGRKRKTISMGIYRQAAIQWPIHYKEVAPDSVKFVPLQWDSELTLTEILKQHPKGKEYAFIQEHEKMHPLLVDDTGEVLSYPPIINSAGLGQVVVGDTGLFIELTGTRLEDVTLSASIVACDLADQGYTIEPVEICYDFETAFGNTFASPYYFQTPVFCSLERIERFLGEKISADEAVAALSKMGVRAEATVGMEAGDTAHAGSVTGLIAWPPEYRNDYLHAADVMEDVMIGRGMKNFAPLRPRDFTIGRLSPLTLISRKVKEILIGQGFQEMIYNYLGSKRDLVDRMNVSQETDDGHRATDGSRIIRIANPMSENFEYVRDSVIASLLESESVSANAVYPHKIFEVGKIAYRRAPNDEAASEYEKDTGIVTRHVAALLHADTGEGAVSFNTIAAQIQNLFYYLAKDYTVREADDSRFIQGRAAEIVVNRAGKEIPIGVFGEVHPAVLAAWNITVPCTAAEVDVGMLV